MNPITARAGSVALFLSTIAAFSVIFLSANLGVAGVKATTSWIANNLYFGSADQLLGLHKNSFFSEMRGNLNSYERHRFVLVNSPIFVLSGFLWGMRIIHSLPPAKGAKFYLYRLIVFISSSAVLFLAAVFTAGRDVAWSENFVRSNLFVSLLISSFEIWSVGIFLWLTVVSFKNNPWRRHE